MNPSHLRCFVKALWFTTCNVGAAYAGMAYWTTDPWIASLFIGLAVALCFFGHWMAEYYLINESIFEAAKKVCDSQEAQPNQKPVWGKMGQWVLFKGDKNV